MPTRDVTSSTATAPIDRMTLTAVSVRSDVGAEPTSLSLMPFCFDASDE